jgi:hypothetical protein
VPIGFDPADSEWIELKSASAPQGAPPIRFRCRYLSYRQEKQVDDLRNRAIDASNEDDRNALLNDAILIGIIDWQNVTLDGAPLAFSREALDELTTLQKVRITAEYPGAMFLTEADRKNSSSPQSSPSQAAAAGEQAAPTA